MTKRTLFKLSAVACAVLLGAWVVWHLPIVGVASERSSSQPAPTALTKHRADELRGKPVCVTDAMPFRQDCVPKHLANLPPHPGGAGMATIEGVDANRDGIRDDIEIFIAENYGDSARAVFALREIARHQLQLIVQPGESPETALARRKPLRHAIACYVRTVDERLQFSRVDPFMNVITEITNTPERYRQFLAHERILAGQAMDAPDPRLSTAELCGYDPSLLPS